MKHGARLAAAIAVLADFEARRVPLKTCLQDWARGARYAGSGDRASVAGLCLDALRRRSSLAYMMDDDGARAAVIAALRFMWGLDDAAIADMAADAPHGPGPLSERERERLRAPRPLEDAPDHVRGDFPEWLTGAMRRVFADEAAAEGAALAARASIDLRVNTLKSSPEKAAQALRAFGVERVPGLDLALRIAPPAADRRAPALDASVAFGKGWVEVQDAGSQIAAMAAGDVAGAQVLDFCAGGGGKTLALAAAMGNTGQIYAFDADARRLAPIFERLRRAGARNVQVRSPADAARLDDLDARMDLVFVDAPCSGAGTWRRKPDAKWRLTERQLERRIIEQQTVLDEAARYVAPGGALVFVTCSPLAEENEDVVAAFLDHAPAWTREPVAHAVRAAAGFVPAGEATLEFCKTETGDLRLSPRRAGTDGFFIARLRRD